MKRCSTVTAAQINALVRVSPEETLSIETVQKNIMTSFGRGRSRICTLNKEGVFRRPGQITSLGSIELDNLIKEIFSLDINTPVPKEKLTDIIALFQNATGTESLSFIVEQLYKTALEDRLFGVKLAIACSDNRFILYEDGNEKCTRTLLLDLMQIDFQNRDDIREDNRKHFQNAASFLGEAYYGLKILSKPVSFLGKPFFIYLDMLLKSATLEDIEIVTMQIVINGKNLCQTKLPDLLDFMNHVREVLVSRDVCAISRGMLLLMIDLTNQRFAPLSKELQEFYVSQLGSKTLMNMQRHGVESSNDTKKDNAGGNLDREKVDVPARVPWKVRNRIHNTTGNVPRAIRGSGAADAGNDQKSQQ